MYSSSIGGFWLPLLRHFLSSIASHSKTFESLCNNLLIIFYDELINNIKNIEKQHTIETSILHFIL